jgi:DnaJ-class molecular chaperone
MATGAWGLDHVNQTCGLCKGVGTLKEPEVPTIRCWQCKGVGTVLVPVAV